MLVAKLGNGYVSDLDLDPMMAIVMLAFCGDRDVRII